MKLVTFQDPIFPTIQGEGAYVGVPSTFIRLWGCDNTCSWCDTKDSWREGSKYKEWSPQEVVAVVRSLKRHHLVVTGGNPLLQTEELEEFFMRLGSGYHVTVETQMSKIAPQNFWREVSLASLSPKLAEWPQTDGEPIFRAIEDMIIWHTPRAEIQIKLVVTPAEDESVVKAIWRCQQIWNFWLNNERRSSFDDRIHFFLQPESSLGKSWVKAVIHQLDEHIRSMPPLGFAVPTIRVLPQIHKTSLFVL